MSISIYYKGKWCFVKEKGIYEKTKRKVLKKNLPCKKAGSN